MCCITFNWKENDAMEKVKHFRRKGRVSWAVIEVTEACNFNCKWCYAGSGYNRKYFKHMEKDKLKKLLEILSESDVKQVTYSGGEPTVYPYLDYAIKEARNLDLIVHINTNGYLLTETLAREWRKMGVTQVQINIDSKHPEKHDKIRGRKGSFDRALKAIRNARNSGITCVSQTVLTRENEKEVLDIIKIARNAGVERVRIWDMMLSGHAREKENLLPKEYLNTLKTVSDFALKTGAVSIEAGEPLFPLNYETGLKVVDSFCVCLAGLLANFSVKGDEYFCCMYRKPLYNIFRDLNGEKFEDFHMKALKKFSYSISLPEKCKTCEFFEKCRGGCIVRRNRTSDGRDYWCSM